MAPGPVSTPAGDSAARAATTVSDYAERRFRADYLYTRSIRKGMDPLRVAQTVLRVVRTARPRPRYPVGLQARSTGIARSLLSPSIFEAVVKWGLGLMRIEK